MTNAPGGTESIVVAGGCFWCIEAVFLELKGVRSAEPGYAGGSVAHPSYEQVCTGRTGHAEVVKVDFDPSVVSLHDLLTIFFTVHDPTTLNRQGPDHGTQYRSAIFYASPAQREMAEKVRDEMQGHGLFSSKIVTEIAPLATFYPAEEYHHNYFARNPTQGYCAMVVAPKVAKFRSKFADRLKSS